MNSFDKERQEAHKEYKDSFKEILNIYNRGNPLKNYPVKAECFFKVLPNGKPENDFSRDVMLIAQIESDKLKDIYEREQTEVAK
jgi:hypothetical protein